MSSEHNDLISIPNIVTRMNYTIEGITSNFISDHSNWTGPGELGGDAGLRLTVKSDLNLDGYVDTAQLNSAREDMLWGSYRTSLKLSPAGGTCAAFFWVSSHRSAILPCTDQSSSTLTTAKRLIWNSSMRNLITTSTSIRSI